MAGDYDNSEPHEYCTVHDQPMDWCRSPDKCREIMTGQGLYQGPEELRRRAADELTALSEELGLYD